MSDQIPDYPGNSFKNKRKVEPVITSKVVRRHTESKLTSAFKSVWDYAMTDIVIPVIKSMLADIVTNAADIMLYGEPTGRRRARGAASGTTRVSYNAYSQQDPPRRSISRKERTGYNTRVRFEEVVVGTSEEADLVIESMAGILEKWEYVTVADLLSLVNEDSNYTDEAYGWKDLGLVRLIQVRDGVLISMPQPEQLSTRR